MKLPIDWWGQLYSNPFNNRKPRVGWAGGASHLGDLELIYDVVKDLSKEVDWVFFGMCPDKLRPFVKEYHEGVPIHLYPKKLASLNLNLAVAPLENNLFNDCKSNLRLLEYGACGIPVVCSDTQAFINSKLPVTIVKNKYKNWINAIRDHINNFDSSNNSGLNLRKSVLENWMLNDYSATNWLKAWSN